jgi:hypothetical protein
MMYHLHIVSLFTGKAVGMQKWEYMIFAQSRDNQTKMTYWDDDKTDQRGAKDRLNDLGDEGWELAAVYPLTPTDFVYILKRPKE